MPKSPSIDNYRIMTRGNVYFQQNGDTLRRHIGNVCKFSYSTIDGDALVYFTMDEITPENLWLVEAVRWGHVEGRLTLDSTNEIGPLLDFCADVNLMNAKFNAIGDAWSSIKVRAQVLTPKNPWTVRERPAEAA